MQNKLQVVSNSKLFKNPSVPSIAIKQFGITMYGILDVKNYLFPSEITDEYSIENNRKNNSGTNNSRIFDDTKWEEIIKKRVYNTTGKAHPNATIICKLIEQELNSLGYDFGI